MADTKILGSSEEGNKTTILGPIDPSMAVRFGPDRKPIGRVEPTIAESSPVIESSPITESPVKGNIAVESLQYWIGTIIGMMSETYQKPGRATLDRLLSDAREALALVSQTQLEE